MSVTKTKRLWDPSPLSMLCSALVYSFAMRDIVLRFAEICKTMFKVWRCHCARVRPLSSTGGTACKHLHLFCTKDGVLNCNGFFLSNTI
jgi:hypothetical protein